MNCGATRPSTGWGYTSRAIPVGRNWSLLSHSICAAHAHRRTNLLPFLRLFRNLAPFFFDTASCSRLHGHQECLVRVALRLPFSRCLPTKQIPAKNANHGRRGMGFSLPPRKLGAADAHQTTANRSTTTIAAHALIFATQNHRSTPRSHTRNTALSAETTRAAHRPQRQLHEQTTTPTAETTA